MNESKNYKRIIALVLVVCLSVQAFTAYGLDLGLLAVTDGSRRVNQDTVITADENDLLYDEATDTIYLYNMYQLATALSRTAGREPVMTRDMIASEFGMGKLIFKNGSNDGEDYLTYSPEHNYVLADNFTRETPALKARLLTAAGRNGARDDLDGRGYKGQVVYIENGRTYILIGNEQQLQAIGKTDSNGDPYKVTEPVWEQSLILGVPSGSPKLYYKGDADIDETTMLYSVDSDNVDVGKTKSLGTKIYLGSKKTSDGSAYTSMDYSLLTTYHNVNMEVQQDLYYTTWADYIIFRDIDLTGIAWNPLMFSGSMEGRFQMRTGVNPVVSNIVVTPAVNDGKLDTGKNVGIGFFGTITNQPDQNNYGISAGTCRVRNITLDTVTVNNNITQIAETPSLVSGLMNVVGGLLSVVGGVVEGLLKAVFGLVDLLGGLLGVDLNSKNVVGSLKLSDLLTGLLNVRKEAPDTFATGGFAGRVIGDVEVAGCKALNVSVSNDNDMNGGFVGNAEGLTEYDGLSQVLNDTTGMLTGILDIIPGLGLGDLITVLLNNPSLIDVGNLIPTAYKKAKIIGCEASFADGSEAIGNESTSFNGGFAGALTGAEIEDSSVNYLTGVTAAKYAGGFAGIARDAVIRTLLSNLGVNILESAVEPSSKIKNCSVNGINLTVDSIGDYAGGFTGAMANSRAFGSSVTGLDTVTAANYSGGFAGRATVGYAAELGKDEYSDLISSVGSALSALLTGENGAGLLSLAGVSPSELYGCTVSGTNIQVWAGADYAGGLLGQGDGTIISVTDNTAPCVIGGLANVSAENFAGGAAGQILTANGAGVLDNTLGIAYMLGFTAENIDVAGGSQGYTVAAGKDYSGGAFGQAIGGQITNVTINSLASVKADNYAGGFVGGAGAGSLVSGGGLNLLGLDLLKANNLLSLAQGVELAVNNCQVNGIVPSGFEVTAVGSNSNDARERFVAAGFAGQSNGARYADCSVNCLKSVSADPEYGYAGGFSASTSAGGLASVAADSAGIGTLLNIDNLLNAVGYLMPDFTDCTVSYNSGGGIDAAVAGGFIGDMQSGRICYTNDDGLPEKTAVMNLGRVTGTYYAGGFAGRAVSGGLASGGGLSLLGGIANVDTNGLISVMNTYYPTVSHARVESGADGLRVRALITDRDSHLDSAKHSGSAGGFVGYAAGAHISYSDVDRLTRTKVNDTKELSKITDKEFDGDALEYAVSAPRYAGGFAGVLDIANAASVGSGLELLDLISADDLLSAVSLVASKVSYSDVKYVPGGYSVLAFDELDGSAGGFAGAVYGSRIQACDAQNFEYIIGRKTSGGYVGDLEPGDVSSVLGGIDAASIISADNVLTLLKTFVPYIYNSETTCVPCGGVVRAGSLGGGSVKRGMAGGYAGYNGGGRILGNNTQLWSNDLIPASELKPCSALRLRAVYGAEFAGGYVGLMECVNAAYTGSIDLLGDLIGIDNPLSAVQAVFPVCENTGVTGPLRGISLDVWNSWVTNVGSKGAYGNQFAEKSFDNQEELNTFLEENRYIYGCKVIAGRDSLAQEAAQAGVAGGYAGRMSGGVVNSASARDIMSVRAFLSAGGFAGETLTADVLNANVGGISIGEAQIAELGVSVLNTFVPVINSSSVTGFGSGLSVEAFGYSDAVSEVGNAGGFVGLMIGGHIRGLVPSDINEGNDGADKISPCGVFGLRRVDGRCCVGGFAGKITSGGTVALDSGNDSGLLNMILETVGLNDLTSLLSLLNLTVSTVQNASVGSWDGWGITVNGAYSNGTDNTAYAKAAGGFAGSVSGAVIGERDGAPGTINVSRLRTVIGGDYAGGFFGLADVDPVLGISGDGTQSLVGGLLQLGSADVLEIFRTYIYGATVTGSTDAGLAVCANTEKQYGAEDEKIYSGAAGGFGGGLLNSTALNSGVSGLRLVQGLNYAGGFVGHSGKSGVLDADKAGVGNGNLLNSTLGVLDVFGSAIINCGADGIENGFSVKGEGGSQEIAGGFVGYADLAKIENCTADNVRQVSSGEIAGGFVGRATHAYLADAEVSTEVLETVAGLLGAVLDAIDVEDIQDTDINAVRLIPGVVSAGLLNNGQLLSLNLLGLPLSISLNKAGDDEEGQTALVKIAIGGSEISLPYSDGRVDTGSLTDEDKSNLTVSLIQANRTRVTAGAVTGIAIGYNVYSGGSGDGKDAPEEVINGYAGGFIGYNDRGLLENNQMYYCDVVKGTGGKVGPFSGKTEFAKDEDTGNQYRIYRQADEGLNKLMNEENQPIAAQFGRDTSTYKSRNVFLIDHISGVGSYDRLKNAVMSDGITPENDLPLNAYVTSAKAVLMDGTDTDTAWTATAPEPVFMQDPCSELADITVTKVWRDRNDHDKLRPTGVTLTLNRSWVDDTGAGHTEIVGGYENVILEGAITDNVWSMVIVGMPVHTESDGVAKTYNYVYYLTENSVEGYYTTVKASENGYSITITNRRVGLLPYTGGIGAAIFYITGLALIAALFLTYRKKGRAAYKGAVIKLREITNEKGGSNYNA